MLRCLPRCKDTNLKAIHNHYKSAEEVADRVMKDLLDGVDPRKMGKGEAGVRFSAKQKRALETVSASHNGKHQPTVVSNADGAKILKNLDSLADNYENSSSTNEKTFIGEVANSLGINAPDKSSKYATFETKNGKVVTVRLSNHNAKVSNFDANDEVDGISIVVSAKKSSGITNDGNAHVTEYYYDAIKLRKAEGKPLAEVVKSIKQLLYSGEFNDPTGLAEVQEVNADDIARLQKVYHVRFFRTANGEAYGFTVGGKIYIDPKIATSETPVHEYAHLWASALRSGNPKEWQNVVGLMKGTSVWEEVKKRYSELNTDDEIADEVIATYSGRRGAERLREEAHKVADGNGDLFEKAEAISALGRVKESLKKFWKGVCDFLHIHYKSAEEVADRVMKDLLDGVDTRKMGKGEAGARFSAKQKRALETAEQSQKTAIATAVSSADGAKVLKNLDTLAKKLEEKVRSCLPRCKDTNLKASYYCNRSVSLSSGDVKHIKR